MSMKLRQFVKSKWFIGATAVVLGVVLILGIRFFTYKTDDVHYHANFAIYINGQRQKLDNPLLYEEVEMCTESKVVIPAERAHLHDMVSDVAHVEDQAVTWGHFLLNIDHMSGTNYISVTPKLYVADDSNKVTYILNGEKVSSIANKVIGDKDRLLIDFGTGADDVLKSEYDSVPNNAAKYDATKDPESCSGHETATFTERLKHLFNDAYAWQPLIDVVRNLAKE